MYKLLPILLFAYGLALTTDDIYDNSYALIIGIDNYKHVSNLDYAVKDANSIAVLLKDNFNFQSTNIKTLINDEATFLNIRSSLEDISASAKENDRVLIYFAGHGATDDLPDGGEMGYLLPIDGKREKLFSTSIPMDDIKRISSMSKSKHMLFLIDACYGGLSAVGARGLDARTTPNYIDKITQDKARQIITAGGRGEEVIEKSEWGHSAFTMNLLRALEDGKADFNDDGYITADELGLFLKEKVTIDSENKQTPQSRRFTSHEGEFVFINYIYIENQDINLSADSLSVNKNFIPELLNRITTLEQNLENDKKLFFPTKQYGLDFNPLFLLLNYQNNRFYFTGGLNIFSIIPNTEIAFPVYYSKELDDDVRLYPNILKLGINYRKYFSQNRLRANNEYASISDGFYWSVGAMFTSIEGYECFESSSRHCVGRLSEDLITSTPITKENFIGLTIGYGVKVFSINGIYIGGGFNMIFNLINDDIAIYNPGWQGLKTTFHYDILIGTTF